MSDKEILRKSKEEFVEWMPQDLPEAGKAVISCSVLGHSSLLRLIDKRVYCTRCGEELGTLEQLRAGALNEQLLSSEDIVILHKKNSSYFPNPISGYENLPWQSTIHNYHGGIVDPRHADNDVFICTRTIIIRETLVVEHEITVEVNGQENDAGITVYEQLFGLEKDCDIKTYREEVNKVLDVIDYKAKEPKRTQGLEVKDVTRDRRE